MNAIICPVVLFLLWLLVDSQWCGLIIPGYVLAVTGSQK